MRFTIVFLAVLAACSGKSERVNPLVETAKRCAKGAEMTCGRPIVRVANLVIRFGAHDHDD